MSQNVAFWDIVHYRVKKHSIHLSLANMENRIYSDASYFAYFTHDEIIADISIIRVHSFFKQSICNADIL